MKRKSSGIAVGIFFIVGLAGLLLMLEMMGGLRTQNGYALNTTFKHVGALKEGDPVKIAGVEIGRIKSISLLDNRAKVEMLIEENVQVKSDSVAQIQFTSLFGQLYLGLTFGSPEAPAAMPGTTLPSLETPQLSEIFSKVDKIASNVETLSESLGSFGEAMTGGAGEDNPLAAVGTFFKENGPKVSLLLSNANIISEKIATGEGTLGKLVNDDSLYLEAKNTLQGMNQSFGSFTNTNGTLGKLLNDDRFYEEATEAATQLNQILSKINQGQGSAGKFVNDDALYKNAKVTLQKMDNAAEGFEDQGPLSVLGILGGQLF